MPNEHNTAAMQQVSIGQLVWLVEHFPFRRQISAIHLHHSRRPNHRQYRGRETILAMMHQHVDGYGFGSIAQHLTISPDGAIWLGRNWNAPPASATGHNGGLTSGPLMIMLIGDFDHGQDRFDLVQSVQAKTTLELIALLQEHFELAPESLRFHRQMSNVTSPGSSIDYSEFLIELRKARTALHKEQKQGDSVQMLNTDSKEMGLLLDIFCRSGQAHEEEAMAELGEYGMGSRDFNQFVRAGPGRLISAADRALPGQEIIFEMLDELRPHVINLTMGRFSTDGVMQTEAADVDALFEDHLVRAVRNRTRDEPLRLLFYAHGGLVGEKSALLQAYQHVPWWRKNHVYPTYFVWETGLLPMFLESLRGAHDRALTREAFTDGFVEKLARGLGGPRVWQAIKSSAQTATTDAEGGAHYTIGKLKSFLEEYGDHVELHAVGHSAGSIFHSFFVPALIQTASASVQTLHLLAPAITVQDFKTRLTRHMGNGIKQLPIFTMRKDLERNDPVASPWYNRSILYLVSNAMEPVPGTPVLGLEESLRADRDLMVRFGLRGRNADHGEVIWAKSASSSGRSASNAASHVQFTCDPATMNSVLRRVIGADDLDPIEAFPTEYACGGRGLHSTFELTPELEGLAGEGLLNPRALFWGASPAISSETKKTGEQKTWKMSGAAEPPGGGQRRALCIGIDNYAVSPLAGCVADARLWAETLQQLGFAAPTLLLNEEATRSTIIQAFEDLILSSRAGDVVVIQFSGHGINLPDIDGDEADQDSPNDEALCPIDFESGAYLIDDDIAAIFARTPTGVNVTCFFDFCHSGTSTRFAVGRRRAIDRSKGERERFLPATPERIEKHRIYRRDMGYRRAPATRGPAAMHEVVFSACLSHEVALESNGHGHFTVHATNLLQKGIDGISNEQFQQQVITAFGPARRQSPHLDCAPAAYGRLLLQPIVEAAANGAAWSVGAPIPSANGAHNGQQNGSKQSDIGRAELLHKLLSILEH